MGTITRCVGLSSNSSLLSQATRIANRHGVGLTHQHTSAMPLSAEPEDVCRKSNTSLEEQNAGLMPNSDSPESATAAPESFHTRQERMRRTALSSLIVQGASVGHRKHLYTLCRQYADVRGMYHYVKNQKLYTIVETASPEDAWNIVQESAFTNQPDVVPCRTRLLSANSSLKRSSNEEASLEAQERVCAYDSDYQPSEQDLLKKLRGASNFSEQTYLLHQMLALSPIGERLRFFVASQLEDGVRGFFRNCRAYLFGSSVGGFGKHGCDLDVMLELDERHSSQLLRGESQRKNAEGGGIWSLSLQSKFAAGNERVQLQRNLEMMADFMKVWMPSFSHIQRILAARVPILKFDHDATGISGDLCMSNGSAVEMCEIFYAYGEMDCRLRPLVFLVRVWAKAAHVTNPFKIPGRWLTNYHLSVLCIYFMQSKKVLPSLQELATERDEFELVPNIRTRVAKADLLPSSSGQQFADMESLVKEFFIWCATFDFKRLGFSLIDARQFPKPDFSALYVQNPVEPELNISRNVSVEEVDKFQSAARAAVWYFENAMETRNFSVFISCLLSFETKAGGKSWGVLNLISPATNLGPAATASDGTQAAGGTPSSRLVDLRNLFSDDVSDKNTAKSTPEPSEQNIQRSYSVEVRATPPAMPPSSFAGVGQQRPDRSPPSGMAWPSPPTQQQQHFYQSEVNRRQQQNVTFASMNDAGRRPQQQQQQQQHRASHTRQNNNPQHMHKKYEQRLGRTESTVMPVRRKW